MKKQLLLLGGGHAHMITLARLSTFLEQGFAVSVVQPSDYHYYSGMGPGMLGGTYKPDDIRFATRALVEKAGATFIYGKVERIDPLKQLVYLEGTATEIPYDVLSCNVGSYVPRTIVEGDSSKVFTSKPIEELQRARQTILDLGREKPITVAIIGSGPSAVEIAGNIHQLCKAELNADVRVKIQLFGGHKFMSGRPEPVRRKVRKILEQKNIEIIEAGHVTKISEGAVAIGEDQIYEADVIFPAVGVKPSEIFVRSGLPVGPDGGLQVNEYLQSIKYENILGGGDCIYFEKEPLDKVGVYAVRQNEVLYENLLACLQGKSLHTFSPGGSYLLIYNLGDGEGVFSKWFITFSGKLAFTIKDYIDRRFITTFQKYYP